MTTKQGLLLLNLGSPDSTETKDIRRYLKQFLSDPRVIDISAIGRWLLLNLFILPFRPAKAAEAYKKIWTDEGSPLVVHTRNLAVKIQSRLDSSNKSVDAKTGGIKVDYAMRYQNPSIPKILENFQKEGIDRVTVLPLFPQYSSAANGSAAEAIFDHIRGKWNVPKIEVMTEFYDHPGFLTAFADIGKSVLADFKADRIMFSFHGLPERHCIKSDESEEGHCLKSPDCCEKIVPANRRCYRAQCFATAKSLAEKLDLKSDEWELSFQSRLGRSPWIKPYFDERITALPGEGIKRLAVYSPAFVADCLETLEEIEIRASESFVESGGEELRLIPSLNSNDLWVDAIIDLLKDRSNLEI